ncbi:hypothetical protein ATANTOWER_027156, partial [Ataeniobius toweri]|nr:hypothetical protein [Ataeniobius toweri]
FLQNNSLQFISKHAFSGLYSLRKLFLSDNFISSLSPGVFKDLNHLEWLYHYLHLEYPFQVCCLGSVC